MSDVSNSFTGMTVSNRTQQVYTGPGNPQASSESATRVFDFGVMTQELQATTSQAEQRRWPSLPDRIELHRRAMEEREMDARISEIRYMAALRDRHLPPDVRLRNANARHHADLPRTLARRRRIAELEQEALRTLADQRPRQWPATSSSSDDAAGAPREGSEAWLLLSPEDRAKASRINEERRLRNRRYRVEATRRARQRAAEARAAAAQAHSDLPDGEQAPKL